MALKNNIFLFYAGEALQAAEFYTATFPDSEIQRISYAPMDMPGPQTGDVLLVELTVLGIPVIAINVGQGVKHDFVFSFHVSTDTQEETDRYWDALIANGGEPGQCGWLKDRWGISWQITPRLVLDSLAEGGEQAKRMSEALQQMSKLDIATLEAARRGVAI